MKVFSRLLSASLSFKILSGLMLSLLPMLIIVWITYASARSNALENSELTMKMFSENGAKEIDSFFKSQAGRFSEWTNEDIFRMAI